MVFAAIKKANIAAKKGLVLPPKLHAFGHGSAPISAALTVQQGVAQGLVAGGPQLTTTKILEAVKYASSEAAKMSLKNLLEEGGHLEAPAQVAVPMVPGSPYLPLNLPTFAPTPSTPSTSPAPAPSRTGIYWLAAAAAVALVALF